jgi:hypothetical protein
MKRFFICLFLSVIFVSSAMAKCEGIKIEKDRFTKADDKGVAVMNYTFEEKQFSALTRMDMPVQISLYKDPKKEKFQISFYTEYFPVKDDRFGGIKYQFSDSEEIKFIEYGLASDMFIWFYVDRAFLDKLLNNKRVKMLYRNRDLSEGFFYDLSLEDLKPCLEKFLKFYKETYETEK